MLQEIDNLSDLMPILQSRTEQSNRTLLWVDVLIKPVLLMMLFRRAEKEADWALHLLAVRYMIPHFFAAHHPNYAHYGLYYPRFLEALSQDILHKFMKGDHVIRHTPGTWNAMWTDMTIETTFMRYGKDLRGIIGMTMKPNTLKTWALSLHSCSVLIKDV